MRISRVKILCCLIYLISTVILISKLASPVNIQVVVYGEEKIRVKELPRVYTYTDVLTMLLSSIAMSSSIMYLALSSILRPRTRTISINNTMSSLSPNERKVLSSLMSKGGVAFQSEIVEGLGLPKSTVSVILDKLETRGIVEKRRRGINNIVIVKSR